MLLEIKPIINVMDIKLKHKVLHVLGENSSTDSSEGIIYM